MGEQIVSSRVVTLPNALSALRLALVPVFAVLIVTGHDVSALLVLVLASVTDYLDGFLARRWDQMTRLGQVLDPAADRFYIVAAIVGLAWRDLVPWWLVAAVVARDVVLLATVPALARRGLGTLPVHAAGKAATFALLCAFPLILLGEVLDPTATALGAAARAIGWAFAWWGTGLYWWVGWLYLRQVSALTRGRADLPAPEAAAGAQT